MIIWEAVISYVVNITKLSCDNHYILPLPFYSMSASTKCGRFKLLTGVCIQYSLRVSIPVIVHWSDSAATPGLRQLNIMLKGLIMRIIEREEGSNLKMAECPHLPQGMV